MGGAVHDTERDCVESGDEWLSSVETLTKVSELYR